MMDYKEGKCSKCMHDEESLESSPELEDGTGRKSIGVDRVDDMPAPKVKRFDGLPTVEDLREMMGQGQQEESMGEKVSNMVEIILKLR